MPALDQKIIDDLHQRLTRFLSDTGGFEEIEFLDAGGSAAVFRVRREGGELRAVKAFDPLLFTGLPADASRRRLDIQRRLIGHRCPSLIQTFYAEEAHGTAFIEMEFNAWPQLAKQLPKVPDVSIVPLIGHLVDAVRFLESLNIVHRDIKPENIHVSEDFTSIKLLDLGVAREFDTADENDAAVTDNGERRPFLATAQYSSPEYLFRLDEPTAKLWKGLNFYQIGAVLHDLIKKEALFQQEINLGNRWLVARAVLTKQASFNDGMSNRLGNLKALAIRCLTKDIDSRLSLVGWEDFLLEGAYDPIAALRGRLSKGLAGIGGRVNETSAARLAFERSNYVKRVSERIRTELIGICGTQLPATMRLPAPGEPLKVSFVFSASNSISIECFVEFEWLVDIYERTTNIRLGARIMCAGCADDPGPIALKLATVAAIQEAEDETVSFIATDIARLIGLALDRIDAVGNVVEPLHAVNFQ